MWLGGEEVSTSAIGARQVALAARRAAHSGAECVRAAQRAGDASIRAWPDSLGQTVWLWLWAMCASCLLFAPSNELIHGQRRHSANNNSADTT